MKCTVQEYLPDHASTVQSVRTYTGCFPLHFTPTSNSGGEASKDYGLANLLKNDHTVYSSAHAPPIFISFQCREAVTLTEVVVKAPDSGYTCPVQQFEMVAYARQDGWGEVRGIQGDALMRITGELKGDCLGVKHVFTRPISGVQTVILNIKSVYGSSSGLSENVDLQYVGFGGFCGSHSFPSASLT